MPSHRTAAMLNLSGPAMSEQQPEPGPQGAITRGELYWLEAAEGGGSVRHPHVVVSEDVFNRSRVDTVILCALTTNLGRAREPGNVLLGAGEGNLPRQSVIVVSQISSVDKRVLKERIGALSEERVEQALAGLRFQQASFFPRP